MEKEELINAYARGLQLEAQGYEFYKAAADETDDAEGKNMFEYLAAEEQIHYDRVRELFEEEFYDGYTSYMNEHKEQDETIFDNALGGSAGRESDALDALNIGIQAEERSIVLYKMLAGEAVSDSARRLFGELVREEEKHRAMLESEVEYVTETGEFHDFKIVTM